ncbi:alkaline phosphatase D family protein [Lentisphaera profundi]|uniref:Alkaline phosphatase D family protein n=1 Tax=Lentisphaera profundi TaxID=1658616 RepID=A0ABY7W587_9BACT|nr:alkaline phosphatase D family protein [Lentisphaera profundi]WDE99418.1 alkaline phosphatase D family protein [Lentisphaera profundi]
MKTLTHLSKLLACISLFSCTASQDSNNDIKSEFHNEKAITKIAFGSCSNPKLYKKSKGLSHELFNTVIKKQADVFVFLGDNIYGDTEDMALFKKKYQALEDIESFRNLRDKTQVIATWDDHDFGVNDGGKTYPKRVESQKLFLDFFKDPADSPRRQRPGVYTSYTFGDMGQRCQIIVLDTRYFRDLIPRVKGPKKKGVVGWYEPTKDTSKTLLGEAQWKWLEQELQTPADVRIIASSIQMLSYEKGMENWGNVPHEQKRFFDLLKKYKCNNTIAISGDVHFAELSKKDIGSYPFYDMTSSGITNTSKGWSQAHNSFRVGKASAERNAGMIEIDWTKKSLQLGCFSVDGKPLIQQTIPFKELTFK